MQCTERFWIVIQPSIDSILEECIFPAQVNTMSRYYDATVKIPNVIGIFSNSDEAIDAAMRAIEIRDAQRDAFISCVGFSN
jgi:hypothetical protein